MREIMSLADKANQYVDKMQPWVLSKADPEDEVVQQICTTSLSLFRILAIMLKPVTPELANKIAAFFNDDAYTWNSIDEPLLEQNINQFKPLLGRIEDQSIEQLIKPEK
jgi:methionyl-tRNA synthetase